MPIDAVGGIGETLLVEERVRTQSLLYEPGCRGEAAELFRIPALPGVTGEDLELGRERFFDPERGFYCEATRRE